MRIDIRVLGADDPEFEARSLYEWLKLEQDLDPAGIRSTSAPIRDGDMGSVLDIVTVAIGAGGAVTVLASSLSVWLRHRGVDLKIEVSGPNRKVIIEARRVRDPKELIDALASVVSDE